MTRIPVTRFLLPHAAAAALTLGVAGLGQAIPAASAAPLADVSTVSGAAAIPVTFTTVTPHTGSTQALCQTSLQAVATGRPVSVAAAPCLRTFVLEADRSESNLDVARAHLAPEACEALLPKLAIGEPVRLGAALPCVEDYVMSGAGQMAAR